MQDPHPPPPRQGRLLGLLGVARTARRRGAACRPRPSSRRPRRSSGSGSARSAPWGRRRSREAGGSRLSSGTSWARPRRRDRPHARRRSCHGPRRLFLAAMRIDGDEVDYAKVAEAVAPAVGAKDEELAGAAVDFLGRIGPDISDRDVRRDLADELLTLARDAAAGIELRASAAMGAYGLGGGSQIVKARRVLKDFLESSDPTLRAAGALGFAEMSSIEEVDAWRTSSNASRASPAPRAASRSYMDRLRTQRFNDGSGLLKSGGGRRAVGALPVRATQHDDRGHPDGPLDGGDVSRDDLVEAAMQGMLGSLDRPPRTSQRGLRVRAGPSRRVRRYRRLRPDGPRRQPLHDHAPDLLRRPRAGLSTDDKIIRIDDWPTIQETTDEIIKRLKDRPGPRCASTSGRRLDLTHRASTKAVVVEVERQIAIPRSTGSCFPATSGSSS